MTEKVYRETVKKSLIEGDLFIENGRVEAENEKIQVNGAIRCKHDCEMEGDIEALDVISERGDITVYGSLKARRIELRHGRLNVTRAVIAEEIRIGKSLNVDENLEAQNIQIGGSAKIGGDVESTRTRVGGSLSINRDAKIDNLNVGGSCKIGGKVTSRIIDIGGSFKAGEVESQEVDLGGTFRSYGPVNLESIRVGGTVKIGGGVIRRRIDVGGTFLSNEYLEFGDISVGGTVRLEGGGSGKEIDVGGTFRAEENLTFSRLDVGGKVRLYGGGEGQELNVGGTMKCRGNLDIKDQVKVGGKITVDGDLSAKSVRVGGKLEADTVLAEQYIETSNLYTRNGAKATRIEIDRRGRVKGPLIGDIVTIKDRASVEDIHSDRIHLRRGCRARDLYGRQIWVEPGCDIDSITFTEELRAESNTRIRNNREKVDKLPEPPI